MPVILLQIPYVQQKVSAIVSGELTKKLNVPVKIGNIDFRWFNELVLENLYIEDQAGEILFEANHISAGFEALPLLERKLVFSNIRLFGFTLNLSKATPTDKLNLQFVIDAFAKKETSKNRSAIDLRLNSVLIRKGTFSYNILSEPTTADKFDAKHILVKDISAKIAIPAYNKDSLNAHIKKLSFKEQSGFEVTKLALKILASRDSINIDNFEIQMPRSSLKIDDASIDISKVDSIHQLLDNAPLRLEIAPSEICLKDFAGFVPAFKNFTDTIQLSANASGSINDLDLTQISLKYQNKLDFIGKMDLIGISKPTEAYILGKVNKLHATTSGIENIINNFSSKKTALPKEILQLGAINFTGEISGFFDNLVAFGTLTSAIGTIRTDLIIGKNKEKGIATYLKGKVSTPGLNLRRIMKSENSLGKTAFTISLDAKRPTDGLFYGKIDANIKSLEFSHYTYENIELVGNFKPNGFDGKLNINDPNGQLLATGMFVNQGKNSVFDFTTTLKNFHPDKLKLTDKYESPEASLTLTANFKGNNIDNLEGFVEIDSFAFKTATDKFFLDTLKIAASGIATERKLSIKSNIINGEVIGAYSFKTLGSSLVSTFQNYLPALTDIPKNRADKSNNNFSLSITIENTEAASKAFKLPVTVLSPARILGHYNNVYDKFRFEAYIPQFKIGKSRFESGYLMCDNPSKEIKLTLKTTNIGNKGLRNYIELKADAIDNQVNSLIQWANNKEKTFKSDIETSINLSRPEIGNKKPLQTEVQFKSSPIIINDSLWTLSPSEVFISEGIIHVENFKIGRENQYITIDGAISKMPIDSLNVTLNDIELTYIFDILNIPALQFGGRATGRFTANDLYSTPLLNTDLTIQNFSFNQTNLGKLNLYSEWDNEQKGILMLGTIYKNDSTFTDVNGLIYPVGEKAGLSLHFDANDLNLAFIQPFIGNVIQNLQGRGFGKAHLYGPFKGLTVTGDALVRDGGLGIEYLNTYYTFNDSIHLTPTSILLNHVELYDKEGNMARVSGAVNHRTFKEISFNTSIQASNLLVYDVSKTQNPQISGVVYGTGTTTITGNTNVIDFDVNLRSNPKTNITLDFMGGGKASSFDFITFVSKKDSLPPLVDESLNEVKPIENNGGAELRMNFQIDMTPDASIEMIIDPVSGDRIKGSGTGNIQVKYGTKTDLRMYGGYTIVDGNYSFSLQQVIHKVFKLREGSSINFRGDPFDADLNIEALYYLSANLIDLNELFSAESRTQVPLNCVLKLNGMLRNPEISFDIELPSSSDELEQQMRSIINAEDMMTRQIIYLLVLGKFYTPDYMTARTGDFAAIASSTISSQLSSALNSITDKVQIGANVRTSNANFEDSEVALLLSSQLLNNRLIFNGNFGYRENTLTNNSTNFVGEFDLEYKLNSKGEIRLKAYNHYNDMYRYMIKSAPTTQGVGIMFKKDFNTPRDLFGIKKRYHYTLPTLPKDSIK